MAERACKAQCTEREKENRSGSAPTFDNAPVCTIDVAALKHSRFLVPGPPPRLPYRDEAGRVNVHLLRAASTSTFDDEQRPVQLDRWLQHAERWLKHTCRRIWTHEDGVWTSSDGETRREVATAATNTIATATVAATPTPASDAATAASSTALPAATPAAIDAASFDLAAFERDGFAILRGVVSPDECRRFMRSAVTPALHRAGISEHNPETWRDEHGDDAGALVRAADGGWHPIALSDPESQWRPLFESPKLIGALDALHGVGGWVSDELAVARTSPMR